MFGVEEVQKILVIYTGGTIGMIKEKGAYVTASNTFINKIKSLPQLHDEYITKKCHEEHLVDEDFFVMPKIHLKYLVAYKIVEYDPLLDSSNMCVKDWVRVGKDVASNYHLYDGFVILHGTDTMAYTASALSFMFEGLGKAVVITGSQIPIFEHRSDAKDNFFSSLMFAACYGIEEVCVCFGSKLLRGNRTIKYSSSHLDAFTSPNYNMLGEVGIHLIVFPQYKMKKKFIGSFELQHTLNENVGILHLFPTISKEMIKAFLAPPIRGVVIQSFGIGNIPSKRLDLIELLKDAVKRGVIVVNITQCSQGTVNSTYETGKALEKLGVIPGYDMTGEAALTKLAYVIGLPGLTTDQQKQMMKSNLRGELTVI